MKKVGIIGAGRFGMELAKSLAESGVEVLLVERNGQLVQAAANIVAYAVQGDATSERVLAEAGFGECDAAVVAVGSNVEVSTLATVNCKEMGIKSVVSKATSELHGRILEKLGADLVIYPDRDSARRLARTLTDHGAIDLLELSEGLSIAEVDAPEAFHGKTLAEADVRNKYGVTVLCIRRRGESSRKPRTVLIPVAGDRVEPDDKLIVFGKPHDIDELGA